MGNYNRITFKERVRIEAGIYAKKSFSQIAKELGRSTSSIVREVKQNRIVVKSPHTMGTGCLRIGNTNTDFTGVWRRHQHYEWIPDGQDAADIPGYADDTCGLKKPGQCER